MSAPLASVNNAQGNSSADRGRLAVLLRQPVVQVFAANLLRAGCALAVTLVAARLLGPAEFGEFSTFVALSVLAYSLLGEGLEPGVVRFLANAHSPAAVGAVLGSALALRAMLLLPLLLVFWLIAMQLLAGMPTLVAAACAVGLASSLTLACLSLLQARNEFGRYALLSPAANLLRLLAVPVLWLVGALTLETLVGSYVLAYGAVGLASLLLFRPLWPLLRFDAAVLRKLLRFGFWSALATACFVLSVYLQVPILRRFAGASATGIYAAAAMLLLFIDQFTAALLTTKLAQTSRIDSLAGLRAYVRRIAPRLVLVASVLGLLYPLAPLLVSLLLGPDFAATGTVMQALLPGFLATLLSHPLYLVLYAQNKPQHYAVSGVAGLLGFLACAAWLLPIYGLVGMAWASSLGRLLQAALIVLMVVYAIGRDHPAPAAAADDPQESIK